MYLRSHDSSNWPYIFLEVGFLSGLESSSSQEPIPVIVVVCQPCFFELGDNREEDYRCVYVPSSPAPVLLRRRFPRFSSHYCGGPYKIGSTVHTKTYQVYVLLFLLTIVCPICYGSPLILDCAPRLRPCMIISAPPLTPPPSLRRCLSPVLTHCYTTYAITDGLIFSLLPAHRR